MGLLLGDSRIEDFQIQIVVAFAKDETEPVYAMIRLAVSAVLIRVVRRQGSPAAESAQRIEVAYLFTEQAVKRIQFRDPFRRFELPIAGEYGVPLLVPVMVGTDIAHPKIEIRNPGEWALPGQQVIEALALKHGHLLLLPSQNPSGAVPDGPPRFQSALAGHTGACCTCPPNHPTGRKSCRYPVRR